MENRRNYYRLLQVQPDASLEVIRASYRTLMRELKQHPDLGGSTSTAALLNEAYRVLCDPILRTRYDRKLFAAYSIRTLTRPGAENACAFCRTPCPRAPQPEERCQTCGSLLRSQKAAELDRCSRRAVERMTRHERVLFCTEWPQSPQEGRMVDLSPTGMRFACAQKLVPGTVLKILGPDFEASGLIKNVRETAGEKQYAVGVAFLAAKFHTRRGTFLSTLA